MDDCSIHRFAFCLIAAIGCNFGLKDCTRAADEPSPGVSLYHRDAQHLWNRLHEAALVRVGPDDRAYGHDRLEPLLWMATKHLLEERSRDRLMEVLQEFNKNEGEKLIEDPLKRAILQRDLWLVFDWVDRVHRSFEDPRLSADVWRASQQRLRPALAAVIGRLALTPDQIKQLPDNYLDAVASGQFARRFDTEQPDKPYLPPDLFAADSPWVCVGRSDGPVAPAHLREESGNPFTNSVFLVFLKLPGGREAILDYLARLSSFGEPLLVRSEDAGRLDKYLPNPKVPQFPVGSELALVRRAMLIASPRTIASSTVVESLQLRVYRDVPAMTAQTLDAALVGGTAANLRAHSWQSFHEFRLSRSLLFAGRAGGLRPVGSDEPDFKTGFGAHPWDEFEARFMGQSFKGPTVAIKETCFACHSLPGVYSFNSFFNYRLSNLRDGDNGRPALLMAMSPAQVSKSAVVWKTERPSWTSLERLLAK
jgi:hypothetical protein